MSSPVLLHVTTKKLEKLAEQQSRFEETRSQLLSSAEASEDPIKYARKLLEGIRKLKHDRRSKATLANIEVFLKQAQHDASVPAGTIAQWTSELESMLDVRSARFAYADLFGQLVTEWLKNPNEANKQLQQRGSDTSSEDAGSDGFEKVGRAAMHEQRKMWEEYVFTDRANVNEEALKAFLSTLFGTEKATPDTTEVTPFDRLRKKLHNYRVREITVDSIKTTILGIINSDLFAGEKRDVLLDLKDKPPVLTEMVDVLNMELRNLQHWTWEPAAVAMVQRRQVNGKYRFFMDEEIHQAILLQHIGSDLASALKDALGKFAMQAWHRRPQTAMTEEDINRRAYYVQEIRSSGQGQANLSKPHDSVHLTRDAKFFADYFLIQMPNDPEEGARQYVPGEEDIAENDEERKSPVELKQQLMEYLTADILIRLDTRKEASVLLSDFKWFGPSLPHKTILTVLKFLGFRESLLTFFKAFLEAPLVFSQDGPSAKPTKRKAGVPMSHTLSDVMGETVMFCLDAAVNKTTKGTDILRLHDDLWFWGDTKECENAWIVIKKFAIVTGLELNMEKTGSISFSPSKSSSILPSGKVQWGFLYLDLVERRWVIDRTQVDEHIKELRLQLDACRSVFAFVQAWNSYVSRFFTTNFGRACNCHGPEHLDAVITTFEHVQRQLFASGSVTAHLQNIIAERFGVKDVPAGFIYFPTELGGLELRNPFIPLLARLAYGTDDPDLTEEERLRTSERLTPEDRLALARLEEKQAYDEAKRRFENTSGGLLPVNGGWRPSNPRTFFSFEEFSRFREETSFPLAKAMSTLVAAPPEKQVASDQRLHEYKREARQMMSRGWDEKTENLWLAVLYGPEIIKRFDSFCIGEKELLPIGLVNVMRSEKVRWMG